MKLIKNKNNNRTRTRNVTNHESRVAVSHLRFTFQCTSRGGSTSDYDADICKYI